MACNENWLACRHGERQIARNKPGSNGGGLFACNTRILGGRARLRRAALDGAVPRRVGTRGFVAGDGTRLSLRPASFPDRVDQVYGEEQQWLGFCEEQLRRWQRDQPAPAEEREIARLAMEIERLKPLVAEILALSAEIRTGTIDRIMEMSDLELGLKALLGQLPRRS
jgi:hypothetical protein